MSNFRVIVTSESDKFKNSASAKSLNIRRRDLEQKPKCSSQRALLKVFSSFFRYDLRLLSYEPICQILTLKKHFFHIVLALDPLIFITQEWNKDHCVRHFLLYNGADAYAALSLTVFELQRIKASQVDVKIATKFPFLSTSTSCWHMLTMLNWLSSDTIAEYGSFWFQWFLNGEDPSNGLRATT